MIKTRSHQLANHVYEHLLDQIATRALVLGTHLKAQELAKSLAVSPATVRAALVRLMQDGWVEAGENGRPLVVAYPPRRRGHAGDRFSYANQTEQTYEQILAKAMGRAFRPGQIIKARPLAAELGVSIPTAREALEWLCREGVLVRLPRRGWQFAPLNPEQLLTIIDVRLQLEPMVLAKAMERISDEQIAALMDETERMMRIGSQSESEGYLVDHRFHQTLIQVAGDSVLSDILTPLNRKVMLAVSVNHPVRMSAFAEHKKVLEAVKRRDVAKATECLRAHLQSARRHLLNVLTAALGGK